MSVRAAGIRVKMKIWWAYTLCLRVKAIISFTILVLAMAYVRPAYNVALHSIPTKRVFIYSLLLFMRPSRAMDWADKYIYTVAHFARYFIYLQTFRL